MTSATLAIPIPPSPPARRERNAVETKKRLLDAAEEEFAAKGFDGARLGNIARAAGVQHALIHHYFDDKDGLYREVLSRGLGAVTAEGWDILERLAPSRPRRSKKKMMPDDVRALVEAFIASLVDFYATHGGLLRILRHEADERGSVARKFVEANVRPQFDEICARLDEMRARGEVRADVYPRHLVISAVAMACYPFIEEAFVTRVWTVDVHAAGFLAERKREISETILLRVLP